MQLTELLNKFVFSVKEPSNIKTAFLCKNSGRV